QSLPLAKPREHFVPIRTTELVQLLCGQPGMTQAERQSFCELCRLVEATLHFEYHRELNQLKCAYAPFDPDADTMPVTGQSEDARQEQLATLFDRFSWLLERANFRRLTEEQIQAALTGHSAWGLNLQVDFGLFDRLELYARGDSAGTRSRRR